MEADIRYLIDQGKTYFKNQAYKKAEAIFNKILATNREFADVFNMLGVIHHQGGEYNKAITHFQRALKINPHYTEAMLNLSVLYNDIGQFRLAKKLLARSKKEKGDHEDDLAPYLKGKLSNKHAEMGDLYRGVGLFDRAIGEYQRALDLAPHFYDIRNRLAICLRELGNKKDALKEFQKIAKEKPSYVEAQIQLGITHYSLGNRKDAQKVWSQLARLNPRHQLVRMYLRLTEEKRAKAASKQVPK